MKDGTIVAQEAVTKVAKSRISERRSLPAAPASPGIFEGRGTDSSSDSERDSGRGNKHKRSNNLTSAHSSSDDDDDDDDDDGKKKNHVKKNLQGIEIYSPRFYLFFFIVYFLLLGLLQMGQFKTF